MRLIDADALIQDLKDHNIPFNADINEAIIVAPTVDPYKHGTWQRGRKKYWNFRCSECGIETPWDSPYCPQCGAQMEKMDPEEDKEKARARARAQRSSEDVLDEIRI